MVSSFNLLLIFKEKQICLRNAIQRLESRYHTIQEKYQEMKSNYLKMIEENNQKIIEKDLKLKSLEEEKLILLEKIRNLSKNNNSGNKFS